MISNRRDLADCSEQVAHNRPIRAIRWFEKNRNPCKQAIHNILVVIGRNAGTYDPQAMNATEWVRRSADGETRRLREVPDDGGCRDGIDDGACEPSRIGRARSPLLSACREDEAPLGAIRHICLVGKQTTAPNHNMSGSISFLAE